VFVLLSASPAGVSIRTIADSLEPVGAPREVTLQALAGVVADIEADIEVGHPRWVWDDTSRWYPKLLAARVRIERCVDLRLSHVIIRNSALTADSTLATAPRSSWDVAPAEAVQIVDDALFDFDREDELEPEDPFAEFLLQREAITGSTDPARLGLLLAAESAGSLVAAEILYAGLPWSADRHDELLQGLLGPRPVHGERPERLQHLLETVRLELESPDLNPDSAPDLLKALGRVGLMARTTRSWELRTLEHPAIPPLLEYKKLARLLNANGWHWLDTNVSAGRFYPEYVPGGVVTGRWASKGGGGALQLPKQVRGAVIADDGWKFVVADASQLEPRILAALAGDSDMAAAGAAGDLYAGIVASGAVKTREQAKVAMLGAMYGATTGESGRLLPALTRAFPKAIGLVEAAARAGEKGEVVTTRLGRSSPPPGESWRAAQSEAYGEAATDDTASRARGQARSWGRFTRNFVVQGSAAEWALCWMANLRGALLAIGGGAWITESPHLVFFMHDEVVVHCPADVAAEVEAAVRRAAAEAGQLMFGAMPVTFPVTVAVVDNYGEAK
jgi:DNA polymerase-1